MPLQEFDYFLRGGRTWGQQPSDSSFVATVRHPAARCLLSLSSPLCFLQVPTLSSARLRSAFSLERRHFYTIMQANPSMRQQGCPSDTVVVITGVSRGLGRALALELAQRGYTVVGCGRSEERLLELEKSLSGGSKHLLKKVDVACDSSVKEFAQTVMETKGAPAIVSIINRNGKLWELSAAEFDAVIDINIKGAANVMRHFLPLMMGQGLLVNITSGWGRVGAADVTPYCASKWAIEGLTQAVSKEVPQGVTVVALNPGVVNTDMLVSCFGSHATMYQSPDTWAPLAADAIFNLTMSDNGASLNV